MRCTNTVHVKFVPGHIPILKILPPSSGSVREKLVTCSRYVSILFDSHGVRFGWRRRTASRGFDYRLAGIRSGTDSVVTAQPDDYRVSIKIVIGCSCSRTGCVLKMHGVL